MQCARRFVSLLLEPSAATLIDPLGMVIVLFTRILHSRRFIGSQNMFTVAEVEANKRAMN
jgi:hypothetical protein